MTRFFEANHKLLAVLMFATMLALGISSMAGDSGIVDEIAHIPAGYSYLRFGDYRLNPEHPPLLKELAAVPLLFMHLKFPTTISAWTTEPNGQWETGWNFIYHIGNNADRILFVARLPILLLAIVFGYVLYWWTKKRYGIETGLLVLFLYSLSPNILAHARLVTTDLGIAAFVFFAFITYFRFLEKPTWKHLWLATIFFTLVQLAKFSAVLLYPFFDLLAVIAVATWTRPQIWRQRVKIYLGGLIFIYVISFLLIWIFYVYPTWNMPHDVQTRLITSSLQYGLGAKVANILVKLSALPGMKPIVQFLLGVAMVFNRVKGGNTTYFLGQVSNQSFKWYFPLTYFIKEPVTLLFLAMLAIFSGLARYLKKTPYKIWVNFKSYAQNNFVELSFILFILFYAYVSISGNLNLGIRHLFPILPIIYLLVAKHTVNFVKKANTPTLRDSFGWILGALLVWYLFANLSIYPHYVAYFNEVIGGPGNAYKYVSDSNVDWGQDLKHLKNYVVAHPEIKKIAIDYFGGGDPKYYFCPRKYDAQSNLIANSSGYDCSKSVFLEWHAENGHPPANYIAVSETFLTNDLYWAPMRKDGGYAWLRAMTPIAKIGYSIYVYKIK